MTLKDYDLMATAVPPPPPDRASVVVAKMMPQLVVLDPIELAALRHQVDLLLGFDLSKLDLADELALQYQQAKVLLNEASEDTETPLNQRAQIFNSVRAQLGDIIKQQERVYSMERLKSFENAFVKSVGTLTIEARAMFFDLYGTHLKDPER